MAYVPYWDEYTIAETTQEYRDRWDAVAAKVRNFDGGLIEESLAKGWSVEETIAQALEDDAEAEEYRQAMRQDWESNFDRDMSMNH